MESTDITPEAEYANAIAQQLYDEGVALMDKVADQIQQHKDGKSSSIDADDNDEIKVNDEPESRKMKYENEEAFDPVEAMKMLCELDCICSCR